MEEDAKTEFKRMVTKESMKTVVAFSNTDGGSIYYGIDDDGSVAGVDDPDSESLKAVQLLADSVRPDIAATTEVNRVVLDGRDVIRVDVQEGPSKPYYLRDKGLRPEGVYVRRGPSSVQASDAMIVRMIKDGSSSFEATISMVQDLTFDEASKVFEAAGVEFGENQKRSLGFYEGELYTNLAYLVSDQCEPGIKLAAYSDRYKTEFIDRAEVHGSILVQANRALEFLNAYNPLRSKIDGLRRKDYRAYPESSLREVLINSVVHRDYSLNADTLVSVFKDGLTVSSYGGLRRGIGIDDIMEGISSPRNPKMAALFYRLGFIESFGTGIPHIMGDYRDALVKPSISLSTNVFKIELPVFEAMAADQKSVDAVMDLASRSDTFSRKDAEELLGISRSKAGEILGALVGEGKLEKIGEANATRYRRRA